MDDISLTVGSHRTPEQGACVIEWLRLQKGLDFNDECLPCQCPVLHSALITFNDKMPDSYRQQLKPIALASLGTANDGKQQERAFRLVDAAVREWLPMILDSEDAAKFRALEPITDSKTAVRAARSDWPAAACAADAAAACAADAAAACAADAAAAAAWAAAACAAAAAAAAATDQIWNSVLKVLETL